MLARPSLLVVGARPRTLPAAVVPVAVGTAVAYAEGAVVPWRVAAAFVVALGMQIGANYANDYSDGLRGADDKRVGPTRLVASGMASTKEVKGAALASFAVAGAAGLALALAVSPWLLVVGAACFAAGWLYTGGPKPYGYAGLGELFVFVFFGLVAVVGSTYVEIDRFSALAVLAAVPVGLLIVALLVVNNLRDLASDATSAKRTLAVRMGTVPTRWFYAFCVAAAYLLLIPLAISRPWCLIALASIPFALPPLRRVLGGAEARELVAALSETGKLQLLYGLALAVGLAA